MILGVGTLAALFVSNAIAGCGDMANWRGPLAYAAPAYTPAVKSTTALDRGSQPTAQPSLVGMWGVQFISQGNTQNSPPIPDGTLLDFGYQIFHSDGTEWMNSGGRAPSTQNFCEGVWGETGFNAYELNHFAFSYDASSGTYQGPVNIKEQLVLSPSGDSFSGTFTINAYDTKGNNVNHVTGNITGTRITVDTLPTPTP
jgi:hypothetical protein